MEVLQELTSDDLKEIGINKLGHRKIILKGISDLKTEQNSLEKVFVSLVREDNAI